MEPARGELGIPPTISSALAMEQHAHMQQGAGGPPGHVGGPPPQQQSPITPQHDGPPLSAGPRKRKKAGGEAEEGMLVGGSGGSEPRRLRRSHEACARCRSKKIKASLSGDTDAHRQMPDILTLPPSATLNTQSVPPAPLLVYSATKKTDTGKRLLLEAILRRSKGK